MSIDVTTEKRFEADIEEFFSITGRWIHIITICMIHSLAFIKILLLRFVQRTQPKRVETLFIAE